MPTHAEPLQIIYQADGLVAVIKPAGLAHIPGRGETDCLLHRLARQLMLPCTGQTDPRLRVVHRLDKDTSGVVLFATTIEAQRHLSHQFQNNLVQKEYLAIVVGRPAAPSGLIDAPLAPDPRTPKLMAVIKHGRPARTDWLLETSFRNFALIRAFPKTGKTHQIRVHLKHVGMPLAVDPLYNRQSTGLFLSSFKRGYRAGREAERPLIARLTLHAHRLSFLTPAGQSVTLEAPLPKDFVATLNMLTKYGHP